MTEINTELITRAVQAEFGPMLEKASGSFAELELPEIEFLEIMRSMQILAVEDEKIPGQAETLKALDELQIELNGDLFFISLGLMTESVRGNYLKRLMRERQNRIYRKNSTVVERSRLKARWKTGEVARERLRNKIRITLMNLEEWERKQAEKATEVYQLRQLERAEVDSKKETRAWKKYQIALAQEKSVLEEELDENPRIAFLEILGKTSLLKISPEDSNEFEELADRFSQGELVELCIGFGANVTGEAYSVTNTDIRNIAYILPALEAIRKLQRVAERDGLQMPILKIYFADEFLRTTRPGIADKISESTNSIAELLEKFINIFYPELLEYIEFDFEPLDLDEVSKDSTFQELTKALKQNNELAPQLTELGKKYNGDPFEYAVLHAYYAGDFDLSAGNTIMIGGPGEKLFNQVRTWVQEYIGRNYLGTDNKNTQLFQNTGAQPPYLKKLSGYSVRDIANLQGKIPGYLTRSNTPAGYDLAILKKYIPEGDLIAFCKLVLG